MPSDATPAEPPTAPTTASPRRRRRRTLIVLAAVSLLVIVIGVVVTGVVVLARRDDVVGRVRIPAGGGVSLDAQVTAPSSGGAHPLVVMPASWASSFTEYSAVARQFADAGFVVVAYSQRGFGESGGKVDNAGSATQRDASTVIDWALEHTASDPQHIGMLGVSYGAGVSLLAAARDRRVRAVVAMSTWASLAAVYDPNDTTTIGSLSGLLAVAVASGHPDRSLLDLVTRLQRDPTGTGAAIASEYSGSSPQNMLDGLRTNRPAIMLANGFEDSTFAPQQLVSFYDRLSVPKRLRLSQGDHGQAEQSGLAGRPNAVFDEASGWLRHYLAGAAAPSGKPIQVVDATTGNVRGYDTWPQKSNVIASLAAPAGQQVALELQPSQWSSAITTGGDSAATSTRPAGSTSLQPLASMAAMTPQTSFLWSGPALTRPTVVTGTPTLCLSVASSASAVTMVNYLYDVDGTGTGRLMSVTPLTVSQLGTGVARPVCAQLEPTAWTLAAGHHLALAIDTVDPRYASAAPAGSTLTLSSSATAPASLSVPTG